MSAFMLTFTSDAAYARERSLFQQYLSEEWYTRNTGNPLLKLEQDEKSAETGVDV